ncbi:hypothetical protein GIB67_010359 [Kingdonia uniflora]|uniref:Uncharacterized protein n=1 Tax=Kingdonia uniflora TaxID=39325 RepID=A0A7J7MA72_9MAGN|nr:hypothetical protein GIB67_010359 [Kingdonia uniflora]
MSSSEEPDTYTLSIVLSICSSILSIRTGKQVHGYILRSGFGSDIPLGNALITMSKSIASRWTLLENTTPTWSLAHAPSLLSRYTTCLLMKIAGVQVFDGDHETRSQALFI